MTLRAAAALCLAFVVTPDAALADQSIATGGSVPAVAPPSQSQAVAATSGRLEVIGHLEGIPRHRIAIPTLPEDEAEIVIDGRVDEPLWQQVPHFDNMLVYIPSTGEPAPYPSEVRLLATERALLVSAVLYQPPDTLVSRITNRDEFIDRDSFGITLDTTGQGLFAYWFIFALGDSLMDGKVLPETEYETDWDGTWIGKSARFEDGWSVELLLPWSMMDLPKVDGPRKVGFAVTRQVSHTNEQYQWPGYPFTAPRFVTALNTMEITGVRSRQQYYALPYSSTTIDQARDEDEVRVGADLYWRPSPELGLTASAYPDFGAVEADDVVLNLTAFETFFPEKRVFFLEGNEVFDTTPRQSFQNILTGVTNEDFATTSRRVNRWEFLPDPITLLNTRRIGGTATQVTVRDGITPDPGERDLPTDLLGAAKLTGTSGSLRYGALGAFEDDVKWFGTDSLGNSVDTKDSGRNFGVGRLLYETVGANRTSVGYIGTLVKGSIYDAVVHGADAHFTSASGRWIADVQGMYSDVDDLTGYGALFDLQYTQTPNIQHKIELDYFDEDVDLNDLGFLRRNDYVAAQYVLSYDKAKGTHHLENIRGTVVLRQEYNISEGQVVDSGVFWRNSMILPGRNTLNTALAYLPKRWEDVDSRGNGAYRTDDRWWADIQIATDASRKLSYSASIGALQENLGDWTYSAAAGVTLRPSDWFSFDLDLRHKHRHGWVVYQGGRNFGSYHAREWQANLDVNWFIAPRHMLRMSLQWVGVRADERGFFEVPLGDGHLEPAPRTLPDHDFTVSILTTQVRYRWEIAPLTDLYLVYNLGNNLLQGGDPDFSDLFRDAFSNPIVENFVIKLRYRFGN